MRNEYDDDQDYIDYSKLSKDNKEIILEEISEEFFGGLDINDVIQVLKEKYPEDFL
jgi:hypothetical protein